MFCFLAECVDELYTIPFTPELLLAGYLTQQKVYVERKWLVDEITTDLLSAKFQQKGVLLAADLGYGKTAFISHMICAKDFRNRILAYHICKYDVLLTRNPAFFIRRLIGMIAMRLPEFGNQVSMLINTSIIYDRNLCQYDANGCFDQGILLPLRGITETPHQRFIIVIDALDECSDGHGKTNHISELIRKRAHELPSWIGFLITSRNTSEIRLLTEFGVKILSSNDPRNLNDIREYIVKQKESLLMQLKQLFGIDTDGELIDKLVNKTAGNFLFLTHAFAFWLSSNRTMKDEDVPSSLNKIYELNFERLFGTDEDSFRDAKLVLEVVCAALHHLQENQLIDMLNVNNFTSLSCSDVRKTLERLSMFLKNDNGILMFTHISIQNWLVSEANLRFPISIENGAKILSEYLFHMLQLEYNATSFVELVLHVSRANSPDLEEKFRSVAQNKTKKITGTFVLHKIVETTDNPKAIDLILPFFDNIDTIDERNFSATCIAAIKGHTGAFTRLIELGANINLTVNPDGLMHRQHYVLVNPMINIFKQKLKTYNLLHIASQFGHLPIVDYILSKQRSLMYSETAFGYLPMHVACEFGRKNVLTFFFENENMVPDYLCLYNAAKNQHESVVKLIFDTTKPVYNCISDEEAEKIFYSIRISKLNDTTDTLVFSNEFVQPLDVWWKIRQDTPLHIAIRNGNVFISKLIASKIPTSLDCVDGGGFTPFLTSIRYRQIDIFKEFLNQRWSDICTGPTKVFDYLDTVYEYPKVLHGYPIQSTCRKGITLEHLLADSGDKDMLEYYIEKGYKLQLQHSDISGATPLHYAACAGNIYFLVEAYRLGTNFSITAKNGSSPYHSAIDCYSVIGFDVLSRINGIPNAVDSNMSLGLYLVSTPFKHESNNLKKERTENEITLLEKLSNSNLQFITNRDNMKRNIFHYALHNGHYHCVQYLLTKMPVLSLQLLLNLDVNGENPIMYAVRRLNQTVNVMSDADRFPNNCSCIDVISYKSCLKSAMLEYIMSPVEQSLLYVMMYSTDESVKILFEKQFFYLILHSKTYLVPYLIQRIARNMNDFVIKDQIFKALKQGPEPFNILSIFVLIPDKLIHCDSSFLDPPLHALAKRIDKVLKVIASYDSGLLIDRLFETEIGLKDVLHCIDRDGITLLERAVKERSFLLAAFLIKYYHREINFTQQVVSELLVGIIHSDLVTQSDRILIKGKQRTARYVRYQTMHNPQKNNSQMFETVHNNWIYNGKFTMFHSPGKNANKINTRSYLQDKNSGKTYEAEIRKQSFYEKLTVLKDQLVSEIIFVVRKYFNARVFCHEKSELFSPVHLLAANDMHKSLLALKIANVSVLACANNHGVTPIYLAQVFQAENAFELLQKETEYVAPSRAFEESLLFKLSSNFVDSDAMHPLFFLHNYIPTCRMHNEHKISQTIQALVKTKRTCKFYDYIYANLLPLLKTKYIRAVRTAVSLTSAIFFGKDRHISCFQTKQFLLSFQGILRDIADYYLPGCPNLSHHFKSYSYFWENSKLFTNFEKCSVLKSNQKILLGLRQFSKSVLVFVMKLLHQYLFDIAMKEAKTALAINSHAPFYRRYTEEYEKSLNFIALCGQETPRPNDLVKFRFIDILKGVYIRRFKSRYTVPQGTLPTAREFQYFAFESVFTHGK